MNVIAPPNRIEKARQIALFVLRQNYDGDAHPPKSI